VNIKPITKLNKPSFYEEEITLYKYLPLTLYFFAKSFIVSSRHLTVNLER
jgi:hypothetical protein